MWRFVTGFVLGAKAPNPKEHVPGVSGQRNLALNRPVVYVPLFQQGFALGHVRHDFAQALPEGGAVVAVDQVHQFVGHHIGHGPLRRLDQAPVDADHLVLPADDQEGGLGDVDLPNDEGVGMGQLADVSDLPWLPWDSANCELQGG